MLISTSLARALGSLEDWHDACIRNQAMDRREAPEGATMNSIRIGLGLSLLLTLGASGCMLDEFGDPYYSDPPPVYDPPSVESNIDVKDAVLVGDMGRVSNIGGPASYTEAYGDSYWANVNVHSEGDRGFAMGIVDFQGGLGHADLVPGATLRYSSRSYGTGRYDAAALRVSVTGCAGPSDGDWQFDEPADEVEVKVTEGSRPGYLHFEVSAHWNRGDQNATAQFEARETPADPGATDPYGSTPGI